MNDYGFVAGLLAMFAMSTIPGTGAGEEFLAYMVVGLLGNIYGTRRVV